MPHNHHIPPGPYASVKSAISCAVSCSAVKLSGAGRDSAGAGAGATIAGVAADAEAGGAWAAQAATPASSRHTSCMRTLQQRLSGCSRLQQRMAGRELAWGPQQRRWCGGGGMLVGALVPCGRRRPRRASHAALMLTWGDAGAAGLGELGESPAARSRREKGWQLPNRICEYSGSAVSSRGKHRDLHWGRPCLAPPCPSPVSAVQVPLPPASPSRHGTSRPASPH